MPLDRPCPLAADLIAFTVLCLSKKKLQYTGPPLFCVVAASSNSPHGDTMADIPERSCVHHIPGKLRKVNHTKTLLGDY